MSARSLGLRHDPAALGKAPMTEWGGPLGSGTGHAGDDWTRDVPAPPHPFSRAKFKFEGEVLGSAAAA